MRLSALAKYSALAPLLLCCRCFAQAPSAVSVSVTASTSSAILAQPVVLQAKISAPAGVKLTVDLDKSTTDSYVIAKVDSPAPDLLGVSVLPLTVGKIPVRLAFDVQGPTPGVVESDPVLLNVTSPPLQDPQIADIKPPAKARMALWPWLLAAALLGLAWWLWRRRKTLEPALEEVPVDTRPVDVAALEDLEALERSGLWGEGRFREFYFRLTEIGRVYLERRFSLPATKLTSTELVRQLKIAELDRAVTSLVKELLSRADLVKFAKVSPEPEWGTRDVAAVRQLVSLTAPKPEPADNTQEARA